MVEHDVYVFTTSSLASRRHTQESLTKVIDYGEQFSPSFRL